MRKQVGIVTVHGTGDTALGPEGEKWFQTRSTFAQRLKARLAQHGVDAEILPFLWTGANSAREREKAAQKLERAIKRHAKERGPVHVIGHSHGGNVANETARILRWKSRLKFWNYLINPLSFVFPRKERIASLTTVGTPFFRSQLSTAESFGGAAFLLLLIISTIVIVPSGLSLAFQLFQVNMSYEQVLEDTRFWQSTDYSVDPNGRPRSDAEIAHLARERYNTNLGQRGIVLLMSTVYLFFIVPLIFIYPIALSGLARILRLRRKRNDTAVVHSIWHPNDEAISFLQRVETLPIEPFSRGSLWRSSRTAGIVWGVRAILWLVLAGLALMIAGWMGWDFPEAFKHFVFDNAVRPLYAETEDFAARYSEDALFITPAWLGGALAIVAVVGMPVVFVLIYLITRLLVFGLTLEIGLRNALNKGIGGVLKGIAFGQDGDERIGEVHTQSHCHGAHCVTLQGEVADRMQKAAGGAADKLIEKYRWALFTVGSDTNAALEKLATDAMTWESLIHTTYFDQPEIVDMIADYIIAQERAMEAESKTRKSSFSFGKQAAPELKPA
jgi:hypothetical protein